MEIREAYFLSLARLNCHIALILDQECSGITKQAQSQLHLTFRVLRTAVM